MSQNTILDEVMGDYGFSVPNEAYDKIQAVLLNVDKLVQDAYEEGRRDAFYESEVNQ